MMRGDTVMVQCPSDPILLFPECTGLRSAALLHLCTSVYQCVKPFTSLANKLQMDSDQYTTITPPFHPHGIPQKKEPREQRVTWGQCVAKGPANRVSDPEPVSASATRGPRAGSGTSGTTPTTPSLRLLPAAELPSSMVRLESLLKDEPSLHH
jgi:hypothetical protein